MATQLTIQCVEATVRLSRRTVIGPISLEVGTGTVVALIGPNGSGKTTLLRALVGLQRLHRGRAVVNDALVRPRQLPPRVGAIIEEPRFIDWLTGRENLDLVTGGTAPNGQADQALEAWGLADRADEPVRDLSQGLRQRLGLARCEMLRPTLRLLDEPTNALDAVWQTRLWEHLRAARAEGHTTVIATHNLDVLDEVADRCVVLRDGDLLADFMIESGMTAGASARAHVRDVLSASER